jgi:hypothetical protein
MILPSSIGSPSLPVADTGPHSGPPIPRRPGPAGASTCPPNFTSSHLPAQITQALALSSLSASDRSSSAKWCSALSSLVESCLGSSSPLPSQWLTGGGTQRLATAWRRCKATTMPHHRLPSPRSEGRRAGDEGKTPATATSLAANSSPCQIAIGEGSGMRVYLTFRCHPDRRSRCLSNTTVWAGRLTLQTPGICRVEVGMRRDAVDALLPSPHYMPVPPRNRPSTERTTPPYRIDVAHRRYNPLATRCRVF